jgi:hypothetical protein
MWSNGNSFSNGNSVSTGGTARCEPWWFRAVSAHL